MVRSSDETNAVIPLGAPRNSRYADMRDLFVSDYDGGDEIAGHAAVIDVPSGRDM